MSCHVTASLVPRAQVQQRVGRRLEVRQAWEAQEAIVLAERRQEEEKFTAIKLRFEVGGGVSVLMD